MEDKICPLRIIGASTNDVVSGPHGERVIDGYYKCFGEKCAWFIKNDSGDLDLAECAVMSLVSIQDIVR